MTTEASFGKKLRNAQDMVTHLQSFAGYTPPRTQESIASLQTLLTSVVSANASQAVSKQQYKAATDARSAAFRTNTISITRLLPLIKGAVDAQYGKKSGEAEAVNAIIKKMRSSKALQVAAGTDTTETPKTISRSQLSYGSQTQHFNDLVNTINQFTGYNPSNASLKIASLQTYITQLNSLNNTVAGKFSSLKTARSNRTALYTDLRERTQRVKSYVRAQYGTTSNEYLLIKGIIV